MVTHSEEFFKQFMEFLENHPDYRAKLAEILSPDKFVRRDELAELIKEIKHLRESSIDQFEEMGKRFEITLIQMDKRFNAVQEQMDKRFNAMQEQMDKRFEEMDKRFNAMQEQMDKRFEEMDKRFNAMQEQMDKRFEEMDKRFNAMQEQMDKRFEEINKRFEQIDNRFNAMQKQMDYKFDKVFSRLDDISIALGHDFEEFNSLWLQEFLRAQGYPKLTIKKKTFIDLNYEVFPDSTDVEVDVYNEDPFVIGEVTAITKNIAKVTTFLRKVQFLKGLKGKDPMVFYVTYGFNPKIRADALRLLEEAGVKVFTLRQRDIGN